MSCKNIAWLGLIILQQHLFIEQLRHLSQIPACWLLPCNKHTVCVLELSSSFSPPSLSLAVLLCYIWSPCTWGDVCSQINLSPVAFERRRQIVSDDCVMYSQRGGMKHVSQFVTVSLQRLSQSSLSKRVNQSVGLIWCSFTQEVRKNLKLD